MPARKTGKAATRKKTRAKKPARSAASAKRRARRPSRTTTSPKGDAPARGKESTLQEPVALVLEIKKDSAGLFEVVARWTEGSEAKAVGIYEGLLSHAAALSRVRPWIVRVAQKDRPLLRAQCGIDRSVRSLEVEDRAGDDGATESAPTPPGPNKRAPRKREGTRRPK